MAIALLAVGCQTAPGVDHAPVPAGGTLPAAAAPRPTPFTVVSDGLVRYIVPRHWPAAPVQVDGSLREGLMASPDLARWQNLDGTEPGMEAAWLDVSRVGVPSDYFYLAAKWPALPRLVSSSRCSPSSSEVIADQEPVMSRGGETFGDFAATASGTCRVGSGVNRWSYFVAAPSYGPVRRIGLPDSGLYLVVGVMRNGPRAAHDLHRMVYSARFGHASVRDLMMAARRGAQ